MAALSRNLAIVIGINTYQRENGIKPLGTAVDDAKAIAQTLKDEYKYSQIWELYDEQATYEAIKTLLNETLPQEVRKGYRDRLLFYFAGHGITRKGKDGSPAGYLIPQDAKVNLQNAENDQSENFLPMQELYDAFKTINSHHLLVILDCCYAGMFRWATRKLGSPYERIHQEDYARFTDHPAWQVIASAAHDQEALDLVTNGRGAVPGKKHSPFASALLQGLGHTDEKLNADLTEDRVITTQELYFCVGQEVSRSTSEQQTPGFWSLRDEFDRGEFIFVKPGFDPKKNLTPAPPLDLSNNPYRGLESFEERHARFFFGRTALVKELSDRLAKPGRPFTVVLGVSGSGKSSLVKAGLIPYLRDKQEKDSQAQKWYILDFMRPGESPFTALARAILPLEDVNLLSQLNQIKAIDEVFKPKTEPKLNSDRSEEARQNQHNSAETDAAFTKLADSWNNSTPEAKLLLIVDYFKQFQEFCPSEELIILKNTIQEKFDLLAGNLRKEPRYLTQVIARWNQSNPNIKLLVIIDQFEELITVAQEHQGKSDSDQKEWQQFLSMLRIALASHRHRLHIVLTLRSDFEPRFLESALKAHWRKGRFPVRAMNSDELREAIEQPARKQSLYFEPPNLVGRLIDEVGQMPGALPLLSFTLSELYIRLTKRWIDHPNSTARALGIEDYNQLGGVAGALTRRATEEYDNLVKEFGEESGKAHQATMRRVMLRMVTIEGGRLARRRVPESELVYFDAEENKRVAQVSDRLVKARLLVKGQETGEPYIEPAHDFLVRGWDNLQTWIKEKQEDLLLQQPLTLAANEWKSTRRPENYLWNTNPRLALLKKVLNSDDNWLNQIEAQFVRRSVSKKRSNTIVRWSIAGSVLLGSVIFSTVIWQQLQITQLREKAARSRNLLETDPVAGLVIAIDAIGQNRNTPIVNLNVLPEIQSSLLSAVQTARETDRFNQPVQQGSSVSAVAVSAHKKIVSADESGNVYQWDSKGKPIKLQLGTNNQSWGVTLLSFSPDGNILIVSREKKNFSTELKSRKVGREVKIWDFKQNKLIQLVSREEKNPSRQLKGREVKIWDLKQKRLIQPSVPYSSEAIAATFSPSADLKMIVSGGKDGRIRLWDLQGNELSQSPEKTDSPILAVAFSLDRKLIVSADGNSAVRLWKLESGKILGSPTLIGKCDNPHSVAISWNSQQIICNQKPDYSASGFRYQSFVKVFNHLSPTKNSLSEWEELSLNSMNSGFLTKVLFASFSPNGETIVTGDQDGSIHFWSLVNRVIEEDVNNQGKRTERANIPPFKEVGQPLLGHSSNVESVAFSSDGKKIISGSWDGTIRLWDVEQNLFEEKNFSNQGTNLTLSPDGQTVAIGGKQTDNKATITLLNIIKGKQSGPISVGSQRQEGVNNYENGNPLAVSSNGDVVFLDFRNFRPTLWHTRGTPERQLIGSPETEVGHSIAISPDGQKVVSSISEPKGSSENSIQLWNIQGKPIGQAVKNAQGFDVSSIAISPDNKQIVSGNNNKNGQSSVCLLHLQGDGLTKKKCQLIPGETKKVAFSSDDKIVAIGQSDGGLYLWNWNLQDKMRPRFGRTGQPILSIAFSPDDNKIIAVGDRGGDVHLWNSVDGTPIGGAFKNYTNPNAAVSSIAFNKTIGDGKTVIVAYTDGSVRFWKTAEETLLKVACNRLHNHPVFKYPKTEAEKGAKEACEKYVWNSIATPK